MEPFLSTLPYTLTLMCIVFFVQLRTKNGGLVDVAWSFSFVFLVWCFYFTQEFSSSSKPLIVSALVSFWSLRLGLYLFKRVVGKEEDARYKELKSSWKENFKRNLLLFDLFQGLSISFLAIPIYYSMTAVAGSLDILGYLFFVVALVGEMVSDRQLASFKKSAESSKVCDRGLWRYSRHPNYFFESLHWFSYVFLSLSSTNWPLVLFVALVMLFLITKVTGIPPVEKHLLNSRGQAYIDYMSKTSKFVPWFPK